jgi:hypothetical protein
MFQDDVYVSGELWEYWRETFLRPSICEMWAFMLYDIDDERAEFVRSLAWRGPRLPVQLTSLSYVKGGPSLLYNVS